MLNHLSASIWPAIKRRKMLTNRTLMEDVMCLTVRRAVAQSQGGGIEKLRESMASLKVSNTSIKRCDIKLHEHTGCAYLKVEKKKKASIKTESNKDFLIVFLHGGGYVFGSPESYLGMLADLAVETNAEVLAPDYSLAPEASYPQPQQECYDFVKSLLVCEEGSEVSKKVILAGDSAGGALAIATALKLGLDNLSPLALVLFSPWVDPYASTGSVIDNADHDFLSKAFLDVGIQALMKGQEQSGTTAEVCFADADLSRLPRTYVQYGTAELFRDQIEAFVASALAQGVDMLAKPYLDQCHDFQFFTAVSSTAKQAIKDVGSYIKTV